MTRRILCIEDDARLRDLICEFLAGEGYRVSAGADGFEGLLRLLIDDPDLVICDIRMPRLGGFELLERMIRLGSAWSNPPFLFLTALADRESALRGRRLGADDYLVKPIDWELLREILRARLDRFPPRIAAGRLALSDGAVAALTAVLIGDGAPIDLTAAAEQDADLAEGVTTLRARALLADPALRLWGGGSFQDLARDALDSLKLGIVAVDGDGLIHYANQAGMAILGLRADEPRLAVSWLAGRQNLGRAVRAAARRDGASPIGLSITDDAAQRHVFAVIAPAPSLPGMARLYLQPLADGGGAPADLVRGVLGLTAAETRLALALAGGATINDFAANAGLSINTARVQLRAVLEKVGLRRQADLVRLLVELSAGLDWRNVTAPRA